MTIEYIRYRVGAGRAAAFEAAYARAATPLGESPHCVDYELARCVEDPGDYILRITWTSVNDHLEGFRGSPEFGRFLAEIREYVPDIQEMRHYEPTSVAGPAGPPTLYEWAGGRSALLRLTETFYRTVLEDELLEPVFRGMDPAHPRHVADWLGEVFGGPPAYSGHRGGHRHMIGRHLGRAITEQQRRRWVSLLLDAADEAGLPADPEFRAAFAGYLEWGSRLAVVFSRPGAEVDVEEPMPRWDWTMPPWKDPASGG
ncbi:group II truncated hemoglobin [Prauserella muralis]|uniref:Antibiotic biosynthesis monooxygenase n=1 Tax=Prauserella muralis TaxID=588067 RepID=A0A2V4B2H3_9PSEU|nr:antibiotic biosynthesis monooxygenase [Prauserella muralis]PXY22755.1 antibiotic biosynthesis monooxygenase [Prauserella muralis]TWE28485.1 truncated hemoglobin YjbI [Prauserella muralis]